MLLLSDAKFCGDVGVFLAAGWRCLLQGHVLDRVNIGGSIPWGPSHLIWGCLVGDEHTHAIVLV